jgi:ankyrin repeat protein
MNDLRGSRRWASLGSVFCVSFSVLAFEVGLTRVFAVLLNYHYAFLIVSGAVCGLGLGGLSWHLLIRGKKGDPLDAGWVALGFALLMPITVALLFGAPALLSTHLWTAFAPLLPFAFAGAFLADVFRRHAAEGGRLYQADLAGAGLAALLVIPLVGRTGALDLVFILGGIAALGAAYWALSRGNRTLLTASLACLLVLPALGPLSARTRFLRVSPLTHASPGMAKLLLSPDRDPSRTVAVLDSEWSAYARTDFVRSDVPEEGFYTLEIFTDSDTPSLMMPFWGDLDQAARIPWFPRMAFDFPPNGRLLSVGPGAGLDFIWGALAGFETMDGVEVNASSVRIVERYRTINGDIYRRPGVSVTVEDGRSFVRRSQEQYDLIVCSLTQTATTGNLGHALVESYIHTQQAFADYFDHLTPNGRYAIVTQSRGLLMRAAFTAIEVMRAKGVEPRDACNHLMAFALPNADTADTPYGFLLIWKKSPLTDADIAAPMQAVDSGLADSLFLPRRGGDELLSRVTSGDATLEDIFSSDIADEAGPLNLRPATDDRPFFLDLHPGIPGVLRWLLGGSIGLAFLFSLVLLRTDYRGERPVRGWVIYFAALGVGFMLIEIPLIQKSILLLGHPTLALAAVLFCVLVAASLGSRLTQSCSLDRLPRLVLLAGVFIGLVGILYALALSSLLSLALPWPLWARLAVLGLLVFPLGLAMGIPFPSGVRLMSVSRQAEIPWMWGVNGLMSVAGGALAIVGAKLIGFNACLVLAALIYAALALSLRGLGIAEEASGEPANRRARARKTRPTEGTRATAAAITLRPAALLSILLLAVVYCSALAALTGGGPSPLHQAALQGRTDAVARALHRGADVNARDPRAFGWTPLDAAAFAGRVEVAKLLLARGADINASGTTGLRWPPLFEAAFAGHADMVSLLLAEGADASARDPEGRSPLHIAARVGALEPAKLLLSAGADPNARDSSGCTPLYEAALFGMVEVVDALLSAGADPNAKGPDGTTALHLAASIGCADIVKALIADGADVNSKQDAGPTPLHFAATAGRRETVAVLLEAGADVTAADNAGRTALWWAGQAGEDEVAEMLRAHGARE